MSADAEACFRGLAQLLAFDPAGRGVAGLRPEGSCGAARAVGRSAARLCQATGAIGIVTGFCIPSADPPAAETDGPLGALALARVLAARGATVHLVTDTLAAPLLELGAKACGLSDVMHFVAPWSPREVYGDNKRRAEVWLDDYMLHGLGQSLAAMVAIERVGPSHTIGSILGQSPYDPDVSRRFETEVPPEHRDRCHNMRGDVIDRWTAPLHLLFERLKAARPESFTLGIGDGGNEIGMGSFAWSHLCAAIRHGPAGRLACRIATDEVLTAGTSNWGAYALAAAIGRIDRGLALDELLSPRREEKLLELLVVEGGAVDGTTGRRTATVDGIASDDYREVLRWIVGMQNSE